MDYGQLSARYFGGNNQGVLNQLFALSGPTYDWSKAIEDSYQAFGWAHDDGLGDPSRTSASNIVQGIVRIAQAEDPSATFLTPGVISAAVQRSHVDSAAIQSEQASHGSGGFLGLGDLGNLIVIGGLALTGAGLAGVGPLAEAFGAAATVDATGAALASGASTVTAAAAPELVGGGALEFAGGAEGAIGAAGGAELAGGTAASVAGAGSVLSTLSTVSQVASTASTLARVLTPSRAPLAPLVVTAPGTPTTLNLWPQASQAAAIPAAAAPSSSPLAALGLPDSLTSGATATAAGAGLAIALALAWFFSRRKG